MQPADDAEAAQARLADLGAATWTLAAVGAAVERGLPALLLEPADAAALAQATGLSEPLAARLAEALVAPGLARRDGEASWSGSSRSGPDAPGPITGRMGPARVRRAAAGRRAASRRRGGRSLSVVPELPEVEITARRLDAALSSARIESALAPGINALKTFDPPLSALEGREIEAVGRRGKHLVIEVSGGLVVLVHLMNAGRLQLFDKRAGPRDRTSRLLLRLDGGRELRLREFGTRQAAWVKLLHADRLDEEEVVATLGPDAWPQPPQNLRALLDAPRPLHTMLRDQRVIAGIGRSWVDEILWTARLSPFKRGDDVSEEEAEALRAAIATTLDGAVEHLERVVTLPIPDKLPMALQVHRRAGEPCPRCGATIEAVHYEDYVMCYCPAEQTGGKVLKDRRLSRLLK